jgi:hypothetical protein
MFGPIRKKPACNYQFAEPEQHSEEVVLGQNVMSYLLT